MRTRRQRGLTLIDLVFLAALICFLFTLSVVGRIKGHEKDKQVRCAYNLKQIALAAIQYSDDKRFFPHIAPINQLDAGWRSPVAVKCVRTLVLLDYDDNPEGFVCPSSVDRATPLSAWVTGTSTPLPLYQARGERLDQATDLSYGWTKRGCTTNCGSSMLVGDKSRRLDPDLGDTGGHAGNMHGNHKDCMQVACLDGHVIRLTPTNDQINTANVGATVQGAGGYMGVLDDSEDP